MYGVLLKIAIFEKYTVQKTVWYMYSLYHPTCISLLFYSYCLGLNVLHLDINIELTFHVLNMEFTYDLSAWFPRERKNYRAMELVSLSNEFSRYLAGTLQSWPHRIWERDSWTNCWSFMARERKVLTSYHASISTHQPTNSWFGCRLWISYASWCDDGSAHNI